ncbi:phosphatidylglycerophosphate synthase [Actinomycetota bacterium]|nr:phosphatidylglycerophosphate synthase [Actinomycetota bacterium]
MALVNAKEHITNTISADGASNKVLTIPNIISLFRILLVPLMAYFILTYHDISAVIVIVVCGLSDFLDGFLARKFNQVTKLGKVLDPIADRLLIFVTLLLMVFRSLVPVWFLLAVLLRELVLLFQYSGLILNRFKPIAVKLIGKVGAAGLMVSMPLLFLFKSPELRTFFCSSSLSCSGIFDVVSLIASVLMLVSLVFYWITGILYCRDAFNILKEIPSRKYIFISAIVCAFVAVVVSILVIWATPESLEYFN